MSYQGQERCLCRAGHLHEGSCYMQDFDPQRWRCPDCGEPPCWHEQVDQTNDAGVQTHLKLYSQRRCTCPHCGDEHQGAEPDQYYVPETPGPHGVLISPVPLVPSIPCGYTVLETGQHYDTKSQAYRRHEQLWRQHDEEHRAALRELGQHD